MVHMQKLNVILYPTLVARAIIPAAAFGYHVSLVALLTV